MFALRFPRGLEGEKSGEQTIEPMQSAQQLHVVNLVGLMGGDGRGGGYTLLRENSLLYDSATSEDFARVLYEQLA